MLGTEAELWADWETASGNAVEDEVVLGDLVEEGHFEVQAGTQLKALLWVWAEMAGCEMIAERRVEVLCAA